MAPREAEVNVSPCRFLPFLFMTPFLDFYEKLKSPFRNNSVIIFFLGFSRCLIQHLMYV